MTVRAGAFPYEHCVACTEIIEESGRSLMPAMRRTPLSRLALAAAMLLKFTKASPGGRLPAAAEVFAVTRDACAVEASEGRKDVGANVGIGTGNGFFAVTTLRRDAMVCVHVLKVRAVSREE